MARHYLEEPGFTEPGVRRYVWAVKAGDGFAGLLEGDFTGCIVFFEDYGDAAGLSDEFGLGDPVLALMSELLYASHKAGAGYGIRLERREGEFHIAKVVKVPDFSFGERTSK